MVGLYILHWHNILTFFKLYNKDFEKAKFLVLTPDLKAKISGYILSACFHRRQAFWSAIFCGCGNTEGRYPACFHRPMKIACHSIFSSPMHDMLEWSPYCYNTKKFVTLHVSTACMIWQGPSQKLDHGRLQFSWSWSGNCMILHVSTGLITCHGLVWSEKLSSVERGSYFFSPKVGCETCFIFYAASVPFSYLFKLSPFIAAKFEQESIQAKVIETNYCVISSYSAIYL